MPKGWLVWGASWPTKYDKLLTIQATVVRGIFWCKTLGSKPNWLVSVAENQLLHQACIFPYCAAFSYEIARVRNPNRLVSTGEDQLQLPSVCLLHDLQVNVHLHVIFRKNKIRQARLTLSHSPSVCDGLYIYDRFVREQLLASACGNLMLDLINS